MFACRPYLTEPGKTYLASKNRDQIYVGTSSQLQGLQGLHSYLRRAKKKIIIINFCSSIKQYLIEKSTYASYFAAVMI